MPEKRKAIVFDRDPRQGKNHGADHQYLGNMQKLADADLALIVKGDQAEIIKLRWADPEEYEVEVVRP